MFDLFLKIGIYVQSVTEEEVRGGIINNKNALQQAFFFDREYTNLDSSQSGAGAFMDMLGLLYQFNAFFVLTILQATKQTLKPHNYCEN